MSLPTLRAPPHAQQFPRSNIATSKRVLSHACLPLLLSEHLLDRIMNDLNELFELASWVSGRDLDEMNNEPPRSRDSGTGDDISDPRVRT